jgi:glucose-6-phosphate isomerase
VVVVGIGGSYMGARALMEACCHPFHNEVDRAQRGGRPRLYFEGNNLDNDWIQGLLDLLPTRGNSQDPTDRWAIIVISKSGETLETAVAFRLFLAALTKACDNDMALVAPRVVPITGRTGRLRDLVEELRCPSIFRVPDGVGGRYSVFSPVGLLPAAVLGIDIFKLLQGAAAMTDHFREAPFDENIVLQFAAVNYLVHQAQGANIRVLSVWSKSLESLGFWYDQLLAESLGKEQRGPTPLTVVNTRDLHSRAQQHQEGAYDKLINNLIVERWRCDSLFVPSRASDPDQLNVLVSKTVPDLMRAAIVGTNHAYAQVGRPTADLRLPAVDEPSLGQLLQMLMLATVVEGRLMKINPYGQPGVEAYKEYTRRELGIS